MLPFAYTPPEKMTTWYFDTSVCKIPAYDGFILKSAPYLSVQAERLVAIKGPNGRYCIRKDEVTTNANNFTGNDPFSLTQKFTDFMDNYADYTETYETVKQRMNDFEVEHTGLRHLRRFPPDAADGVVMVKNVPAVYRVPTMLPGNPTSV